VRTRSCDYCGATYQYKNSRSKFCSHDCRNAEFRQRPGSPERALETARKRYAADGERQRLRAQRTFERIQRFMLAVKTTCGCVDCGVRAGKLDFDHRPGTVKEIEPSRARSLKRAIIEIEKCEVRCSSCHRRRHHRVGTYARA
jgi:hypothetical protein